MNTTNNAAALDFTPCPCGAPDELGILIHRCPAPHQLRGDLYVAICSQCGRAAPFVSLNMVGHGTTSEAIKAWNATLAQPDALTVRIAHKGPSDFPNHKCPAESSAVWNACCMEHERVLAGEVPILTTTALTSQPSGEAVDREEVLRDYVADYEFLGETEDGRDACYQPNERERLLIEDAIRGWIALDLPSDHPSADAPGVAVDELASLRAAILRLDGVTRRDCLTAFNALTAVLAPKPEGKTHE